MKPSYSFVIPVYNTSQHYLEQCVNSCLAQTNASFEIIIVDDGSGEACSVHCDKLSESDDRIRVVHQLNAGVSAARNRGIREAHGTYVLFVDADDYMEPNALAWLDNQLHNYPDTDVVVFSLWREYATSRVRIPPMYSSPFAVSDVAGIREIQKDVLRLPLDLNALVFPYCKCARRELLNAIEPCFPENLSMAEDVAFSLKLMLHARSFLYVDVPLYHYRQHLQSAVNSYRPGAVSEQEKLLACIRDLLFRGEMTDDDYYQGYYLEAFYAMQRIIVQHYFHKDAPGSFFARRRACAGIFAQKPYCDVFRNIRLNTLPKNQRIKAYLLKMKLYACMGWLRTLYFSGVGRKHAV